MRERTLAHAPCPLATRQEASPTPRPPPKSTTGENAPGGSGERGWWRRPRRQRACRVPLPRPFSRHARCKDRLPINAFIVPGAFHFPAARARPGAPLSPPGVASLGRLHNVALCKPAGGIKVRASSASCLKACHCACSLRARAFAVLGGAAVLNPRAQHARARPGERAGHPRGLRPRAGGAQRANLRGSSPLRGAARTVPRAGSRTRRDENRRCRARSEARGVTRLQRPRRRRARKFFAALVEATDFEEAPAPSPRARELVRATARTLST